VPPPPNPKPEIPDVLASFLIIPVPMVAHRPIIQVFMLPHPKPIPSPPGAWV